MSWNESHPEPMTLRRLLCAGKGPLVHVGWRHKFTNFQGMRPGIYLTRAFANGDGMCTDELVHNIPDAPGVVCLQCMSHFSIDQIEARASVFPGYDTMFYCPTCHHTVSILPEEE